MSDFDRMTLKLVVTDRNIYNKYYNIISYNDILYNNIYEQIKLYYLHSNEQYIDKNNLIYICTKLYNDELYKQLIDDIYNIDIQYELINNILLAIKNKYKIDKLNYCISDIYESGDYSTLDSIKEILEFEQEEDETEFTSLDITQLQGTDEGLSWPLRGLNEFLGRIPKSTHGISFGYVETGKTAFATTCSTHWRLNEGATVLHINNEDPIRTLLERYYVNWFQKSIDIIQANLEKAGERFQKDHDGKLFILDSADTSLYRLSTLIKRIQPDIVIIDQLDHFSSEIDPSSLELLYSNIRALAKKNDTRILSFTQASKEALDKTYLNISDLHNSKIGKQAAADYMIGLNKGQYDESKRFISTPKNKLKGIHQGFVCRFNQTLIRYED